MTEQALGSNRRCESAMKRIGELGLAHTRLLTTIVTIFELSLVRSYALIIFSSSDHTVQGN